MAVAYSDNLIYNSRVDSSTERKGGFRPPCHTYTSDEYYGGIYD